MTQTTYSVYEQAKELASELIKMELLDPRNQTDRDVMAATLSPFLQRALEACRLKPGRKIRGSHD